MAEKKIQPKRPETSEPAAGARKAEKTSAKRVGKLSAKRVGKLSAKRVGKLSAKSMHHGAV